MQRFERIIAILLYLRTSERISAQALADRLGVSRRTVYRDLDLLSGLGVPLYAERGRNGGIQLMPGYFLPPVTFTRDEAMSLVSGLALLGSLGALPFAADLDAARRKLLAAVPEDLRITLATAERVLGFETPPDDVFHPERALPARQHAGPPLPAILSRFAEAIFQRRAVHLRYRSPYREQASDIEATPLGMFWDRNRWYLAGVPVGGDRALFRADRVQHISLGNRVEPHPGFDIRSLLGRGWLREAMADWAKESHIVQIAVTAEQRSRLAQDWYYGHMHYEETANGGAVLTFNDVDPDGVFALVRWLGPGAELLKPQHWRARLREQLLALATLYAPEHQGSSGGSGLLY